VSSRNAVTVLVASTGGHLAQLFELAGRMEMRGSNRLWVTFDSEQGRTLLAGESKIFVPYIAERDVPGVTQVLRHAFRILRPRHAVRAVVSTGSAIALSFLPYAALCGIEAHYIESAARVRSPSLTGRVLAAIPGISLYRQYPHAEGGRWRYGGSVFDGFRGETRGRRPIRRVAVTLGMERGFRRLVERLIEIVPPDAETLWQTGRTPTDGLGISRKEFVPAHSLSAAMRDADVVVSHAGCGSALAALQAGKFPILVPRDPSRGEVVDGHQADIARWLSDEGLALFRDVEALTREDLQLAASRSVTRLSPLPTFRLARSQ
jgi:UDP-N-acetylglucosamine--N-acetylmuramyl-(pentapeptide) pyrophosphoryl-undecaprenol N-acetylglucosamine transferase